MLTIDSPFPSQGADKRILIADDDPFARDIYRFMLERAGFAVEEADNGRSTLVQATHSVPDLLLLDVMMPIIDGYSVCQQLRKIPQTANLPILMLSALGDITSRLKGLGMGADQFLTKPVTANHLVHTIHLTLAEYAVRQQEVER